MDVIVARFRINHLLFADDLELLACSEQDLTKHIIKNIMLVNLQTCTENLMGRLRWPNKNKRFRSVVPKCLKKNNKKCLFPRRFSWHRISGEARESGDIQRKYILQL